ncbi:hypothetical protein MMAD_54550 [Mycolicibacterium madagascariense]|uniref:Uncharacterized protein n=1 Tax=Mycolicibacterium madagascariense TaxID=212765 RepID=A0A7I7XPL6_9MYCO|nr:hypothetical protein MMAD_54550 [Mycolicibacterium madagascariense]
MNRINVGIDTTWKSRAVPGLASTSIFATVSAPAFSLAISSSTGAIILQGPHQVAQKSTSTGVLLDRTSLENESSVTATVALVVSLMSGSSGLGVGGVGGVQLGVFGVGEPALGVDRRGTPAARGGDGLAVRVVDQVAAGEDAVDRGAGGAALDGDVPVVVQSTLPATRLDRGS